MQTDGYTGYMSLKKQKLAAKAECTILLRDNKLPCHSRSQVKYSCVDYKSKIEIRNTKQSIKLFICFLEMMQKFASSKRFGKYHMINNVINIRQ